MRPSCKKESFIRKINQSKNQGVKTKGNGRMVLQWFKCGNVRLGDGKKQTVVLGDKTGRDSIQIFTCRTSNLGWD